MALRRRVAAREPGRVGGVPAQLRSRLHPMWMNPDAIAVFCSEHGIVAGGHGPFSAFKAVVEAYAVAQGWVRFYGANSRPFADLSVLIRKGVPMFSCGLFSLETHGLLGRELTEDEWEWIAERERRFIEKFNEV